MNPAPVVSSYGEHWVFPVWLLWFLLSLPVAAALLGFLLGMYFRVGWRRSYSELGWRVRLWLMRLTGR
jgi:hypothetical protein